MNLVPRGVPRSFRIGCLNLRDIGEVKFHYRPRVFNLQACKTINEYFLTTAQNISRTNDINTKLKQD